MNRLLLILMLQNMVLASPRISQVWPGDYVHSPIHSFLQWVQAIFNLTTLPRPYKLFRQWQNMPACKGEKGKLRQFYKYSREKAWETRMVPGISERSGEKKPTIKQGENNVVRADGRECYQDSTAVYQKLHKHLPGCFSFLKAACNPSILMPISQSIRDSINISGRKGKEILSVQDR